MGTSLAQSIPARAPPLVGEERSTSAPNVPHIVNLEVCRQCVNELLR